MTELQVLHLGYAVLNNRYPRLYPPCGTLMRREVPAWCGDCPDRSGGYAPVPGALYRAKW